MDTKYRQLYEQIRNQINSEALTERRLPTERELASSYGVSRQTVRSALALLARDGYIQKKQGSGIYVSDRYFARRNRIALLLASEEDYTGPEIVRVLRDTLAPYHLSLTVYETHGSFDTEREILIALSEEPVRGVLSVPEQSALPNPVRPLYDRLRAKGIPVVLFTDRCRNMTDYPSVTDNDASAAYEMTRALLEREPDTEPRGIFCMDAECSLRRYEGFLAALAETERLLPEDRVLWLTGAELLTLRRTGTEKKLSGFLNRTASHENASYICHNDEIAYFLCRQYAVPGGSVLSFDGSYLSRLGKNTFLSHTPDLAWLSDRAVSLIRSGIPAERAPVFS